MNTISRVAFSKALKNLDKGTKTREFEKSAEVRSMKVPASTERPWLDSTEKLLVTAQSGNVGEARSFLGQGGDPDVKSSDGWTLLHHAVKAGHLDMVELLLNYGAVTVPTTRLGPVQPSLGFSSVTGAYPHGRSSDGSTPLHYASQTGQDQIVQLLLEYGADANSKDASGSTPLHKAAEKNHVAVVRLLLDSNADPEAIDNSGSTPLHYASGGDVALLPLGETVPYPKPDASTPMFPISINGNSLDPTIKLTADELKTKYIIVQSRAPLDLSQRRDMEKEGLAFQEYVSMNTYLCTYQDTDRVRLRELEPVVYIDVYRTQFKMFPGLAALVNNSPDSKITINIVFHNNVDSSSQDLQDRIAKTSNMDLEDIRFYSHGAQMVSQGSRLNEIVTIDEVRQIEEVYEIVPSNN
ncbi:ankyrin repeat-containing domain protein [Nemania abortiva]|nr:ankyrin repeat-containing domain protein [Nemania abortiva]